MVSSSYAAGVISQLEDAQDVGFSHVVFELYADDRTMQPHHWQVFETMGAAQEQRQALADKGGWSGHDDRHIYCWPIDRLLEELQTTHSLNNRQAMNLNNLEDIKKEVANLGFSQQSIDQLEPQMRTGTGYFNVREQLPGDNGLPVDLTLHLRKSNESEYYNLNKFEAVAGKIPPVVPGQQYMVISENKDNPERPLVKAFDSGYEAIEFFKKQKGNSELAIGESPEAKQNLASKEQGTVNYVNNDFKQAYFGSAVSQTFYVQKGVGFSAQQAANMVQGRTVHRDNMLNPNSGETYRAWINLDQGIPKDDHGNYKLKQMNDPNFGFDLDKTLNKFKIKELADPAQKAAIVQGIKNGDRIEVTVTGKDNKEQKVLLEAQPRYKTMDFYSGKGDKLKRELFQKAPSQNLDLGKDRGKSKDKGEDMGMSI
ncbi:hypothetical protein BDD43_3555 [Mucilaginibacter gracilis]|uniref:DUF3945 domain-containing protein n=1 Tax=Mucilaginibacter gracilis TaxID=423350 RepID=A0A495J5T6_9SPHI|nr:hypothetical protein [Mucilaginibacter gracilis]RKR83349.1 hypothetical protein BDD43_3555 [Mucilaginibacter gracilis]